jgi:hypothetical protein
MTVAQGRAQVPTLLYFSPVQACECYPCLAKDLGLPWTLRSRLDLQQAGVPIRR